MTCLLYFEKEICSNTFFFLFNVFLFYCKKIVSLIQFAQFSLLTQTLALLGSYVLGYTSPQTLKAVLLGQTVSVCLSVCLALTSVVCGRVFATSRYRWK